MLLFLISYPIYGFHIGWITNAVGTSVQLRGVITDSNTCSVTTAASFATTCPWTPWPPITLNYTKDNVRNINANCHIRYKYLIDKYQWKIYKLTLLLGLIEHSWFVSPPMVPSHSFEISVQFILFVQHKPSEPHHEHGPCVWLHSSQHFCPWLVTLTEICQ